MEAELLEVADYALSKPGIVGYICVDKDGLCLAARGQVNQSMSGVIHQLGEMAKRNHGSSTNHLIDLGQTKDVPAIKVGLDGYKMIIQTRDSITTALISTDTLNLDI